MSKLSNTARAAVRHILVLALILCGSPMLAVALTGEELDPMPVTKQLDVLNGIGCTEGGEVSPIDELTDVTKHLNARYLGVGDFGGYSQEELRLIRRVVELDACAAYYTEDKQTYLDGCRIAHRLAGHVDPATGLSLTVVCYDKHPKYTPVEKAEILRLASETAAIVAEQAARLNNPRQNYYKFAQGRYLYDVKLNQAEGLHLMYEAALAEYQQNGINGFDKDIADGTAALNNGAIRYKNPQAYRFVAELDMALVQAGKLRIGGHQTTEAGILERLDKWAVEGVSGVEETKPLSEVTEISQVPEKTMTAANAATAAQQKPQAAQQPATKPTIKIEHKEQSPQIEGGMTDKVLIAVVVTVFLVGVLLFLWKKWK